MVFVVSKKGCENQLIETYINAEQITAWIVEYSVDSSEIEEIELILSSGKSLSFKCSEATQDFLQSLLKDIKDIVTKKDLSSQ